MKKHDIPKEILERVENELLVDERLLWIGLPDSRRLMQQPRNSTNKYVQVLLGALLILFIGALIATGGTGSLILYGGLFLLLLFSAIIAPLLVRYWEIKQTVYAITNRRAVVIEPDKVQSFGENELQHIERRKHNNGTGDIIFKTDYYLQTVPTGFGVSQQRNRILHGFFGVDNPEQVEALLLETFQNHEVYASRLEDRASNEEGETYYQKEDNAELKKM